jgi:hypothetical protein
MDRFEPAPSMSEELLDLKESSDVLCKLVDRMFKAGWLRGTQRVDLDGFTFTLSPLGQSKLLYLGCLFNRLPRRGSRLWRIRQAMAAIPHMIRWSVATSKMVPPKWTPEEWDALQGVAVGYARQRGIVFDFLSEGFQSGAKQANGQSGN